MLIIGTTGSETRFLTEAELPDHARLNLTNQPMSPKSSQEQEDKMLAEAILKSQQEGNICAACTFPHFFPD